VSTATTARDFRSQVLHGYWLRVIITHASNAGYHIEHRLKEAGLAGERDQSEQTSHWSTSPRADGRGRGRAVARHRARTGLGRLKRRHRHRRERARRGAAFERVRGLVQQLLPRGEPATRRGLRRDLHGPAADRARGRGARPAAAVITTLARTSGRAGPYRRHRGLRTSNLRYFNLYRPRQRPVYVLSRTIHRVLSGQPPLLYDGGSADTMLQLRGPGRRDAAGGR
jgi:hypothetical protein